LAPVCGSCRSGKSVALPDAYPVRSGACRAHPWAPVCGSCRSGKSVALPDAYPVRSGACRAHPCPTYLLRCPGLSGYPADRKARLVVTPTTLTAPDLGGCVPTLPVRGLLLDSTVAETRDALETAFLQVSIDEAILLLIYIGHGSYGGKGKEAQQRKGHPGKRQVLLFAICHPI
jgi:hypothetical protein